MKGFYAYIRVSTQKQGEKGVSLQEQRAAIERYAARLNLLVDRWFEERVTAAKGGRPVFSEMIKGLRDGDARGVIIHKIDRSARNLRDWADLGELIDVGVNVHFAHETIDLHSRGGRLSADIQAVVASDYIRNLREETLKGIRGRLAQGIIPFGAPIGYLNNGGGKLKTIDPIRGPLVKHAFELYASGTHTLDSLTAELHRQGLRNSRGGTVTRTCLSKTLNNPFYTGVIRIKRTGDTYAGNHVALVSPSLFRAVQDRLSGRLRAKKWVADFALRGLFKCSLCNRFLVGERQKGRYVYYRCHAQKCPSGCFPEATLEAAMLAAWPVLAKTEDERQALQAEIERVCETEDGSEAQRQVHIRAELGAVKDRMNRLTDAFVDASIDKGAFTLRRSALVDEQRRLEDALRSGSPNTDKVWAMIEELLELARSPQQSYILANPGLRREMAITLCSNRVVTGNQVYVEPSFPFSVLRNRLNVSTCAPLQDAARTPEHWREMAKILWDWAKSEVTREGSEPLCA